MPKHFALIVAAGKSERMNTPVPKPYLQLGEQTVLEHAIQPFLASEHIDKIVIVLARDDPYFEKLDLNRHPKILTATGGATRLDSSLAGLEALAPFATDTDWIWEHDAARPCFNQNDLGAALELLSTGQVSEGLVFGFPAVDTLKQVKADHDTTTIAHTLDRSNVWQAATPQIFPYSLFKKALEQAHARSEHVTDSASALELLGARLQLFQCARSNIKLTEKSDLTLAAFHLSKSTTLPSLRIGHGWDVHAFALGRDLILGGVKIPHHQGLEGHSDADVVIHALCDAMLGSLALGDIGVHFSDKDPTHRGVDSRSFLRKILEMIQTRGYSVHNADITIAAQAPKLAPYILQMRTHLAADLHIALDRISIKATTTEKLGYVGREEGIMTEAVVLLMKETL